MGRLILSSLLSSKDATSVLLRGHMTVKSTSYDANQKEISSCSKHISFLSKHISFLSFYKDSKQPIININYPFQPKLEDYGYEKEWHTTFEAQGLSFKEGDILQLEIEY